MIALKKNVETLLSKGKGLSDTGRRILKMHYGICGHEEMSFKEIAKKEGVSPWIIQRIHDGSLYRLRQYFLENTDRQYLFEA